MVNICTVEDCYRPAVARGWCTRHWRRWRQAGDPVAPTANKPWTTEDDRLLLEARPVRRKNTRASAGATPLQKVAEKLGRTYGACIHRRKVLLDQVRADHRRRQAARKA